MNLKQENKSNDFVVGIKNEHYKKLGEKVVKRLQKNGFTSKYFDNREQVVSYLTEIIKPNVSVGLGGSQTVAQLQVQKILEQKQCTIYNHGKPNLSKSEKLEVMRNEITADVFICSSNAITLQGELINIDGNGNRVAALSFGPKKVIVIAGINKICADEATAWERIKTIAAPQNFIRLGKSTPCVTDGVCADCNSPERGCNIYSIIKRKSPVMDIEVLIVGEHLGF